MRIYQITFSFIRLHRTGCKQQTKRFSVISESESSLLLLLSYFIIIIIIIIIIVLLYVQWGGQHNVKDLSLKILSYGMLQDEDWYKSEEL
jgi:hypothetical protein